MGGSVAGSDSSGIDGSQASSVGRNARPMPGDDSEDLMENGIEVGLMGTLFTVSKEKHPSLFFVAFRLLLDVVQLLLLVMNPNYGYIIDSSNGAWKVFSFLQLNEFMASRGYTFFLVCLYLMVAGLTLNVGLCVWVSKSFANNSFGHVWPIVWLRIYSLIFYQVLDLATFTLLFMTMDCGYFSVPDDKHFIHQEFPDVACFTMPHMAHVGVSAVALVVFMVLATAFTVAEIDLNPKSRNLLGMGHTKVEGIAFFLKFIMTGATVFLNDVKWLSIVLFVCSGYLLWLYAYWVPHMNPYVNHVRVASVAMVFYSTITLLVLTFPSATAKSDPDKTLMRLFKDMAMSALRRLLIGVVLRFCMTQLYQYQKAVTAALWAGLAPAAGLGWLASHLRLKYFTVTIPQRFAEAPFDTKSKFIHKFTDSREVEIAARVLRVWLDEDTLDPDAVAVAERILKAGNEQLGSSPYMMILWSSFLMDIQESYITGYQQLQRAKKAANQTWIEKFAIFVREQEHAQKAAAATAGDSESVDLVSYVEFQRNYSVVLKLTMEAMVTRRGFWQALESHKLARFDRLATTVARIDACVKAADQMFKTVLVRHSNSVKILALYVKFLQGVKNDPWAAARWSAEAEKLQKAEEDANTKMVLGQHGNTADSAEESNKGIIIIGANCVIRMCNDVAADAFGYGQKQAMVGHNVNILIPPPFSKNHNQYVRNYITTGEKKMLGNTSEFVALHKDKYVIPIKVVVTHLSGIGEDSVFMGVVELVKEEKDVASVWLLATGKVLSCNATFTDWLGFRQSDLNGRPMTDFVVEKEEVDKLIAHVREYAALNRLTRKKSVNMKHRVSGRSANGAPVRPSGDGIQGNNRGFAPPLGPVAEAEEEDHEHEEAPLVPAAPVSEEPAHQFLEHSLEQALEQGDFPPIPAHDPVVLPAQNDDVQTTLELNGTVSQPLFPSAFAGHASPRAAKPPAPPALRKEARTPVDRFRVSENGGNASVRSLAGMSSMRKSKLQSKPTIVSMQDEPEDEYGRTTSGSGKHGKRWKLCGVHMRHHMSDETILVDMEVKYGAIGDHIIYELHLRRADDASALMLVADSRGRIKHVTQALAARLGTTVSRLHNGGAQHAIDTFLPIPFIRLHHAAAHQESPTTPTPWGCRAGLPMCVPALNAKGVPENQVYTLSFEQRTIPPVIKPGMPPPPPVRNGSDTLHVITFNPSSMEAAWDARRLCLTVDRDGIITKVSRAADTLFGFCVTTLMDCPLWHILDVLRPAPGTDDMTDPQDLTRKVLAVLADRNRRTPGMSWRVGVSGAIDPVEITALGVVGEDIAAQLTKPAIMNVRYSSVAPRMEGAKVVMPTTIEYEIELWRTDVMVGILEMDPHGTICASGVPGQSIYFPCNLLGAKPGLLVGASLSSWLPVKPGLKPVQALFTEGGILPSFNTSPRPAAKKSGGMKSRSSKMMVGPVHTVKIPHYGDGADLEIRITPVSKSSAGAASNVYLIVRAGSKPSCGRPDFINWLFTGIDPVLAREAAINLAKNAPVPSRFQRASTDMSERGTQERLLVAQTTNISDAIASRRGVQFGGADLSPIAGSITSLPTAANGQDILTELDGPDSTPTGGGRPARDADPHSRVADWLDSPGMDEVGNRDGSSLINFPAPRRNSALMSNVYSPDNSPLPPQLQKQATSDLVQDESFLRQSSMAPSSEADNDENKPPPEPELEEYDDMDNGLVIDDGMGPDASAMADYKRGKRYKKLAKILTGKEITGAITRLQWATYSILVALLIMEIVSYITFSSLMRTQDDRIDFLYTNVRVANEANKIVTYVQGLDVLFGNRGVRGLKWLENSTADSPDMTRLFKRINGSIAQVTLYHQGLYHGFDGNTQRMPEDYGLRSIWEDPTISVTRYEQDKLNPSYVPIGFPEARSLWDLGNLFLASARNLLANGLTLNQSGPAAFANLTDTWFIKTNGAVTLNEAYRRAAAGLLSLTIQKNEDLIAAQNITFVVQAVFLTVVALLATMLFAEMLSYKRHRVYHVFTRVPIGVIHGLASAPLNLGQDQDDELEEEDGEAEGNDLDPEEPVNDGTRGAAKKDIMAEGAVGKRGPVTLGQATETAKGPARSEADTQPTSLWGKLCCCIPTRNTVQPEGVNTTRAKLLTAMFSTAEKSEAQSTRAGKGSLYGGDRGLTRSYKGTIWLVWPFVAWAVLIITVNKMAHNDLKGLEGAISNLNIGGGVFQAVGRTNIWALALAAAYPNATLQATIAQQLQPAIDYLRIIYHNELYGQDGSADDITFDIRGPHASSGVAFEGDGFNILFNANYNGGCLAYDTSECLDPSSLFYQYTSNGLDAMIQKYVASLQELINFYHANNATLACPPLSFVWQVGTTNLLDGRRRVSLAYVAYVHSLYRSALQLHLVSFIFSFIIVAAFLVIILRPFINKVRAEPRRVAELLASLPPEIDVESMVRQAVMSKEDAEAADLAKSLNNSSRNWA